MINKSKLNKLFFLFLWDFKDIQVKNKRMFRNGVNSFITCMLIIMLEKTRPDFDFWTCNLSFVTTYMF